MNEKSKIGWCPLAAALLMLCLPGLRLGAQSASPPERLEFWLADTAAFWDWDAETFARESRPLGFRWTQENQSSRAAPLKGKFFGKDVYEAVVRFSEGTPDNISLSFYNRGDAEAPLDQAGFELLVRELMTTLTETLRVQPTPGTQLSARANVRDDSRIWQRPRIRFELLYSFSPAARGEPYRAEYVRLTARKFTSTDMPTSARAGVNVYEVRENIRRNADSGEVWIDNIPMVDQGPKGYCAAATAERILRFFGQEVDQHQVAQIANTTSSGGTSSEELRKALFSVGRQYSFSLSTHIEWNFKDFLRDIEKYNQLTKKKQAPQIEVPTSGVVQISEIMEALDAETWKEIRLQRRADFTKFKERIRQYVDAGCPLAWSVTLGLFKEEVPQTRGGHLRMIIGYNSKKDEVIFSDSWGKGHDRKTMSMEQAFTITNSLFSLEPRGLRL